MSFDRQPPSGPDPEAKEALRQLRRGMERLRAIVSRAKARLAPSAPDEPAPPRSSKPGPHRP